MIDHITLKVSDFERSKKFFRKALEPIGYVIIMEFPDSAGFGENGKPDFWISKDGNIKPTHIALVGNNRKKVDAFYKAAISAGGTDNGTPGLRPDYHKNYYGAFVLDPDGNNIEVVCHNQE